MTAKTGLNQQMLESENLIFIHSFEFEAFGVNGSHRFLKLMLRL